jgi:hypothetical protein
MRHERADADRRRWRRRRRRRTGVRSYLSRECRRLATACVCIGAGQDQGSRQERRDDSPQGRTATAKEKTLAMDRTGLLVQRKQQLEWCLALSSRRQLTWEWGNRHVRFPRDSPHASPTVVNSLPHAGKPPQTDKVVVEKVLSFVSSHSFLEPLVISCMRTPPLSPLLIHT